MTFTLKPKALTEGTYNVYISTTAKALEKVASFKYGTKPAYTLGDVNNDGSIDAADALLVLQHAVGQEGRILTGTYFSAADINKDSVVDAVDALLILKRAAGLTTDF